MRMHTCTRIMGWNEHKLINRFLQYSNDKNFGPFRCIDDFCMALLKSMEDRTNKKHVLHNLIIDVLKISDCIVFTHGDLHSNNIIVNDNGIVGILDWETAGYYPDYWEFCSSVLVEHTINDWSTFISTATNYYPAQLLAFQTMKVFLR